MDPMCDPTPTQGAFYSLRYVTQSLRFKSLYFLFAHGEFVPPKYVPLTKKARQNRFISCNIAFL